MVPQGYGSVTDGLAKCVADLRLGTAVASISDTDDAVTVRTTAGTLPYRAPNVTLTQPQSNLDDRYRLGSRKSVPITEGFSDEWRNRLESH